MKKLLLICCLIALASCQQQLEPTAEHVNSIFKSKDFTIEFHLDSETTASMSFIEDIIIYKAEGDVVRKTISYDDALLINDFIQSQFPYHKDSNEETPSIIILNTAKKVTLKIPNYEVEYRNLIDKIDL
jgi:hypothetical protein